MVILIHAYSIKLIVIMQYMFNYSAIIYNFVQSMHAYFSALLCQYSLPNRL